MKKFKYLLIIMIFILVMPFVVKAEEKTIAIGPGPVTSSSEYFFDSTISNKITVINHNAYVAGNNVDVSASQINGILFGAGNTVNVESSIDYGFLAGNVVNINNRTNNDLFAAGNMINVTKNATVGRDLYLAGNSIIINTDVFGRLYAGCNEITLKDITINGDTYIGANKINIVGNVIINGTLKYRTDTELVGKDNLTATNIETYKIDTKNIMLSKLSTAIIFTLALLITVTIINLIFPAIYRQIIKEKSMLTVFKDMGFGLLCLFIIPVVAFLIMLTIIGMPIAFVTLTLYLVMAYLSVGVSAIFFGNYLNTKMFKVKGNFYLDALLGITLVMLISFIPYLGELIKFLFLLVGFGMIIKLLSSEIKEQHLKKD